MAAIDLQAQVEGRLNQAGLLPFLDRGESQFLELGDDFFVELVARDSTKLPEFGRIAETVKSENPRVKTLVRAHWEMENVGEPVQASDIPGTGAPRAAVLYPVDLASGRGKKRVWVEVTYLASETFDQHGVKNEDVKGIVREYVSIQLRKGGASYWDPERFPHLEINGDTAEFIVGGALPGWKKRPTN
jgi:hypothetical protein